MSGSLDAADGRPKAVAFPDPATSAVRGRGVALLPLEKLIELKLASGLSAAHRLKDLADVGRLDPSVRAKFEELWAAAQGAGPER